MGQTRSHWSERKRRRLINSVFALVLAFFFFALIQISRSGLTIDTSLRSLAPEISQDALSESLIHDLSSLASRKAVVVLAADTRAQIAAASDYLRAQLGKLEAADYLVKQADPLETAASYVQLLEEYPYNFLRPSLATLLADAKDEQLSQWVLEQLYGSAGQVRLTRFERDPFAALNDYAIYLQERLAGDQAEEIQTALHEGVERYFTVWQFELPEDGLAFNTQSAWMAQLQAIRTDLQSQFTTVEWLQSGVIFFAADSAQATQRNINVISGFGITGIVLMMLMVFRGARPLVSSVLAIVGGVAFAFVVCHSLWGSIHILTLLFGASLLGVAVDYSLHLYYFRFATPAIGPHPKTHFYPALLLSLFTSLVGYSALGMSGLETLQQVAVFSIAGLIFACTWVLFSEPWAVKKLRIKDAVLGRLTNTCVRGLQPLSQVKYLVVVNLALWLPLLAFSGWFLFDDSPKAFITQNPVLMENEQRLGQWLGEYEPATFILVHGADETEVFGKIRHLQDFLSSTPGILDGAKKDLLGIHTLLPSPAEQLQSQQLSAGFFSQAMAEALTETYEIMAADQFADLHQNYQHQLGRVLTPAEFLQRLPGFPRLWKEQETSTGERRIVTAVMIPKNANLEQLRTAVAALPDTHWMSLVDETRKGLQHLRTAAGYYLGCALLLIGGVFVWRYGLRRGFVIGLIPIGVIGAICLVYLVAQVPVTLFHVMAMFLVVGLGVDYQVFVAEMSGKEDSRHFANALMLSAATSSLSFGLLSLSVLPAVSAFGTTVMLGVWGNLIGGFCLISIWPTLTGKHNDP